MPRTGRTTPSILARAVLAPLLLALCTPAHATEYRLYYLGGQSNMDGYGTVSELPDGLESPVDGVWIFHAPPARDGDPPEEHGRWTTLRPGHGVGFAADGASNQYSDRFGVELTLARRLLEREPGERIAFVKYSRGGTSIAAEAAQDFGCWDPDFDAGEGDGQGVNQYDHFLAALRQATAERDIDGDGEDDVLVPAGIVWMQGESDAAVLEETAERYEENLARLMELIRAALRVDDLPVVIGRISDSGVAAGTEPTWRFGDVVRKAQAAYVEADGNAALVTSTDDYGYSDPWHYDSAGYVDLGRRFADALADLDGDDAGASR